MYRSFQNLEGLARVCLLPVDMTKAEWVSPSFMHFDVASKAHGSHAQPQRVHETNIASPRPEVQETVIHVMCVAGL